MSFIISEDQALKDHLKGLVVSDENNPSRPVRVYYRLPEAEERRITYPFITIDLIDVLEESNRAHRGSVYMNYEPEGYVAPAAGFGDSTVEFPIPVSLRYQITTHTRSAWHDRQLSAKLLANVLPLRFGALDVVADNTVRRLDLLEWQPFDGLDADKKRVFRKAYTVAVSAELLVDQILAVQKVASVDISLFHQLEPFIVETADA